jgi:hypothetical protein
VLERAVVVLLCLGSSAALSAGPECAPLDPVPDGSGTAADLVISEIVPGSHIELFNATGLGISFSGAGRVISSPFTSYLLSTLAPGAHAAPFGFVQLPWPEFFADTSGGGEIVLWFDSTFSDEAIHDYVCWGASNENRKAQAEGAGKWGGACAPALIAGAIARLESTTGAAAASYDAVSGASPCPLLFGDGFESGDASRWSAGAGLPAS